MARSRRQRDYKAEYARRIANAMRRAPGITRQQARGHHERERGETEAGYRNRRSRQKYGASAAVLARARRAARDHILRQLGTVKTSRAPNVRTVERGLQYLRVETLREIIDLTGRDIRSLAAMDLNAIAEYVGEDDLRFNPFWYH